MSLIARSASHGATAVGIWIQGDFQSNV